MVPRGTLHPHHGRVLFSLRPGFVYSFTTLDRTAAVRRHPPRSQPFDGYVERPHAEPLDDAPAGLAPMDGAFAHQPCWDAPRRTCTQQMAPQPPVFWHDHPGFPYAVLGGTSLRDYAVSAGVRFRDPGSSAGVIARFSDRGGRASDFRGYLLDLDDAGRWALLRDSRRHGVATLAGGATSPAASAWHRVALAVKGPAITASVDGSVVAALPDATLGYDRGIAGIEAGAQVADGAFTGRSWPVVQFRRLRVDPLP
jgi:hypothetical protein